MMVPIPQDATVGTLRSKVEARLLPPEQAGTKVLMGRRLPIGRLATAEHRALLSDGDIVGDVCESNELLVIVDPSSNGGGNRSNGSRRSRNEASLKHGHAAEEHRPDRSPDAVELVRHPVGKGRRGRHRRVHRLRQMHPTTLGSKLQLIGP